MANPVAPATTAIVVGAGAIGSCTAFFLAQKGLSVTLIEQCSIACAASGKAGGFLALDWCDNSPVGPLARASFRLHEQLAQELGGSNYGYRRVNTLSLAVDEPKNPSSPPRTKPSLPPWIDGSVKSSTSLGSTHTTAQVHPQLFTQTIVSHAVEKYGAQLLIGKVHEISFDNNSRVTGVVVDGNPFPAQIVVLAMGPWSSTNSLISSLTTVSGLKAHSIVLKPKDPAAISPHALFLKYRTREGREMDPEIYPRPTGEVYICGMSEQVVVPDDPNQISPRKESIAMLERIAGTVSTQLSDAELYAEQACFLPCSEDGLPLIGKFPGVDGVYIATGHSCWGILNAPATGASLAELIADGRSKLVDLKPFDPARFARASRTRAVHI